MKRQQPLAVFLLTGRIITLEAGIGWLGVNASLKLTHPWHLDVG